MKKIRIYKEIYKEYSLFIQPTNRSRLEKLKRTHMAMEIV